MPITELKDSVMVNDFVIDGKKIIRESDKIIIPDGVEHIPYQAFVDEDVEYVEIPKTVEIISEMAFCGSGIKSIVIPEGVERIESYTFYDCHFLESVQLPKSLKYIGEWVFYSCESLKSITIPKNVKEIGIGAFEYCVSLKKIDILSKIKKIPNICFSGCVKLENITIPESVEEIGINAFLDCKKLKQIKLSDNISYINESAFTFRQTMSFIKVDDDYVPTSASENKHFVYDNEVNEMLIDGKITAYKAFRKIDGKLFCRGLMYKEGETKFMDVKQLKLCYSGFHACLNPFDVFSFYYNEMNGFFHKLKFGEDIEVHEVTMEKTLFDFSTDGTTKMCCAKITVGRKLSLSELSEIFNNSYFNKM